MGLHRIRFLAAVLALLLPAAFGQHSPEPIPPPPSIFGPSTGHPHAGDPAPPIAFTRVLHGPPASSWTGSLIGNVTVLVFFPDTSDNLQAVTLWNKLVEQAAGKVIQFVWITEEEPASLLPFLAKHPLSGWVFLDRDHQTARAYGLEQPNTVFIGTDGRVAGFEQGFIPQRRSLDAMLEHRITTTSPGSDPASTQAFLASGNLRLSAEPVGFPRVADPRPAFAPSNTVHISSTTMDQPGTGSSSGDNFWSLKGVNLKELITRVYRINPSRIDLPPRLDTSARYDVALVLPAPASDEAMRALIQHGIEDHFHLTATRVTRATDVYVVSALADPPAAYKAAPEPDRGSSIQGSQVVFTLARSQESPIVLRPLSPAEINGLDLSNATLDQFCQTLEPSLDRPVVNETHLQGAYNFNFGWTRDTRNDFLARLRQQMNLVIQPSNRNVEILVFQPR
jgi:uncharacterized protein (TIGR03435 family)